METLTTNHLLPRVVIFNSADKPTTWYFVTLWDLPADAMAYPPPVELKGGINEDQTEIIYDYDFNVPAETTGKTITYVCTPVLVYYGASIDGFRKVIINAGKKKTVKKTGTIDPSKSHSLPFGGLSVTDYQCRPFVIQSDTNTDSYFVGSLVDLPETSSIHQVEELGSGNLQVDFENGSDSNFITYLTQLVDSAKNQFSTIYMMGHDTPAETGVIIDASTGTDLYATAFKPVNDGSQSTVPS